MAVPVYQRILDLFEVEGVNTLFGIPDPNFVHMFAEADARGWSVVAPHHELSAGFMAEAASRMTGLPGLCIGTLGPGMANIAGAIQCAKVENSPVIFLGGQRARITERRVRRGRIQFVRQEPLVAASVKYSASIEYAGNILAASCLNDSANALVEQSALPTISPPSSTYRLSFATFSSEKFSA